MPAPGEHGGLNGQILWSLRPCRSVKSRASTEEPLAFSSRSLPAALYDAPGYTFTEFREAADRVLASLPACGYQSRNYRSR